MTTPDITGLPDDPDAVIDPLPATGKKNAPAAGSVAERRRQHYAYLRATRKREFGTDRRR